MHLFGPRSHSQCALTRLFDGRSLNRCTKLLIEAYIGQGRYVFDIKGNHYRLVAQVLFSLKTVDIRRIMTHADYSKLSKKQLQDL